jgi:hypothetical protein
MHHKLPKVVSRKGGEISAREPSHGRCCTGPPAQTTLSGWLLSRALSQRDFVQTDILDGCPNDREATHLRRKHINLIGALPYIAEQAFDDVGRLNMSVHGGRELVNEVGSQRVASAINPEGRFSKVVTL